MWNARGLAETLIELSREYPHNVRVAFEAAPSRWEPFGIMALEAMAAGCSVVASKVGGLKETVLDVCTHSPRGTGLHVRSGDSYGLSEALRDMLAFIEASNAGDIARFVGKIRDPRLELILEEHPSAGETLGKSSRERVKSLFTMGEVGGNPVSDL